MHIDVDVDIDLEYRHNVDVDIDTDICIYIYTLIEDLIRQNGFFTWLTHQTLGYLILPMNNKNIWVCLKIGVLTPDLLHS